MWKGFDAALLDDRSITWQGLGESFPTRRNQLALFLALPGLALVLHFLSR